MYDATLVVAVLIAIAVTISVVVVMRNVGGKSGSPGTITITRGPRAGEQVELKPGRTRIGALDDNDIVLPSKQVSRYHAELRVRSGRVHIWDLQARNHTYVNGELVKTRELSPGDVITIGDAELRFDA